MESRIAKITSMLLAGMGLFAQPGFAGPGLMVVGNDEKLQFLKSGLTHGAPGRDSVCIVDIGTDPEAPAIVAHLPLQNSIIGPPTNVAVTPDQKLALVTNAVNYTQENGVWGPKPNNEIHVIDLEASPPARIATIEAGLQPSGLAVARDGKLALVCNRAGQSVSVLKIDGKQVRVAQEVPLGGEVAAVAIAPGGKRALVTKFPEHKVAVLDIADGAVSYAGVDIPVGLWPYNVQITPDGRLALTADNGNSGNPDGHVDTVSVIDLEANPPRVIDHVVVGDGPEGLTISPDGTLAVAALLQGSVPAFEDTWFHNPTGSLAVLSIEGKRVKKVGQTDVGGYPEGLVFSQDGKYLYAGNFPDGTVSILRVENGMLVNTGKVLRLPGHPGSMRGVIP